jgi:hypothetical protein
MLNHRGSLPHLLRCPIHSTFHSRSNASNKQSYRIFNYRSKRTNRFANYISYQKQILLFEQNGHMDPRSRITIEHSLFILQHCLE